jgi:hypothetical protein
MMTLEALVDQLRNAYGETLRAVVLYGSAVAGEHIQKQSDYNVLVVVDQFPLDRLPATSAVARGWRDAGNPAPMTFTTHEWQTSADVFPMEYADILERHKVLYGNLPFDGIVIDPPALRLQVEHEALGVVFRLRQGVLLAGTDTAAQLKLLTGSLSSLMIIFRGVLRLYGKTPPQNYAELVRDTSEQTGFDPAPFYAVIHHVRREQSIPKDQVSTVVAGYLRGMEATTVHVDQLSHPRH